jgi:hypothetical protein
MEQLTYLLFIKRLDDLHTVQELRANRLGRPLEKRLGVFVRSSVLFALRPSPHEASAHLRERAPSRMRSIPIRQICRRDRSEHGARSGTR